MIIFKKGKLSKKEEAIISGILGEIPSIYSDFYITRDNLRLAIKENLNLLFENLEKGDFIIYSEEEGIVVLTGFSDKSDRKYLKILSNSIEDACKLLKVVNWYIKPELFVKIKKNNPIRKALEMSGFRFFGDRGDEILLKREIKRTYAVYTNKSDKEGETK